MRALALIGLLAVLSTGCASRITILSAAVIDPQDLGHTFRTTSTAVVVETDAEPAALQRRFADSIARAFDGAGFELVPAAEAETLVIFRFGTRAHESTAVKPRGEIGTSPLLNQSSSYDHFFRILLLEAEPHRKIGAERVIWAGEAVLARRTSRDPGRTNDEALAILDRLCEGALEFLGRTRASTPIGYFVPRP